jgi:glycosyltransferase involved in cell wall biosynthesis
LKRQIINRILARKTSKIVAVSHIVKSLLMERDHIDPSKINVIYNGIDTDRFQSYLTKEEARDKLGLPAESLVIGTVGRLEKPKGQLHLIRAFGKVSEQNPDTKLVIVGTGSLESSLKSDVSRQRIDDSVIFLGLRRDIPDILRAFDIFVMPSLSEGFPMALLEAMSLALPVIVTPVGGIPELVTDERNGIFVPPADESALAKKILDLSANRPRLTRLGNSAKETIFEKFSASAMVQATEALYKSVLS